LPTFVFECKAKFHLDVRENKVVIFFLHDTAIVNIGDFVSLPQKYKGERKRKGKTQSQQEREKRKKNKE
jgi:hypothetical protein